MGSVLKILIVPLCVYGVLQAVGAIVAGGILQMDPKGWPHAGIQLVIYWFTAASAFAVAGQWRTSARMILTTVYVVALAGIGFYSVLAREGRETILFGTRVVFEVSAKEEIARWIGVLVGIWGAWATRFDEDAEPAPL